jgi:hypothetical protein
MLFSTFAVSVCIQEKIAVAETLGITHFISGGNQKRENVTGQGLSIANM